MILWVSIGLAQEAWMDVFDGHPVDGILRTSRPVGDEVPRVVTGPLAGRDLERDPDAEVGADLAYALWLPPDGGWVPAARYTIGYGDVEQPFRAGAGPSVLPIARLTLSGTPPWTRRADATYVRDLVLTYAVEGDPWTWSVFVDPTTAGPLDPFRVGSASGVFVQRQVGLGDGTLLPACVTLYAFSGSGALATPAQVCATDAPPPFEPVPPPDTGCSVARPWSLPLARR